MTDELRRLEDEILQSRDRQLYYALALIGKIESSGVELWNDICIEMHGSASRFVIMLSRLTPEQRYDAARKTLDMSDEEIARFIEEES